MATLGYYTYDLTLGADLVAPFDPTRYHDGITNWAVNPSGRITGIPPTIGYPPGVGKGGKAKIGRIKGNMPGNNQVQNKQVRDLAKKYNLTKDQQRQLHDMISGEGLGYHEVEQVIMDFIK